MALLQQHKALQQAAHYTLELQRPKGKLSKSARQKRFGTALAVCQDRTGDLRIMRPTL